MRWPLLEIKWTDSCATEGWSKLHNHEDDNISQCVSVGWLVHETDRKLVIASHIDLGWGDKDPSMQGVIHIPRAAVTARLTLREATL